MKKEIWKDIQGYEGLYQVSDKGRIKSLAKTWNVGCGTQLYHSDIILTPIKNKFGYLDVVLRKNNTGKHYRIHRLVALNFISNPQNKLDINHIDGNKLNNHVSNLEWCTRKENIQHAIKIGLINQNGEKNCHSKLTPKQVLEIRSLYPKFSQPFFAKKFNVSRPNISAIITRRSWKHL